MSEEISYSQAYEELLSIVDEIEKGEISVDDLSMKVKRAAELIRICKERLTSTEVNVNQILKELEEDNE